MVHFDQKTLSEYVKEINATSNQRASYQEIAVIREKAKDDERIALNMNFLGLDLSQIPSQNYSDLKVFIILNLMIIFYHSSKNIFNKNFKFIKINFSRMISI